MYACLQGRSRDPLLAVARDFSPRVMAASETEVLVDVAGLGALIGPPPAIERELRRAVREAGADARVAIAPTQTIARLLVRGTGGSVEALPVHLLRDLEDLPPAMNQRDRARPFEIFESWGIATLGELAALPAADLSSRLGRRGAALHRLARGLDAAPFQPDAETPRFVGRLELEWPIEALEPLSFVFARLLDPLAAAMERADRGAVAIRLELRLTDRSTSVRVLPLPAPMRDPRVLRTLLLLHLESAPPFSASGQDVMIDAVGIELDPAPSRITQFSLLQRALPSPETLSTLTARLSALIGDARIGSPRLIDSHRADAFAMARFAPDGRDMAVHTSGEVAKTDPILRRERVPPALRVRVEHQRPVHVAAPKRGMPHGAVVQAAGPWRTSGDWWTRRWDHDEWDVALSDGAVCRIFQDRMTERWFLAGVYD